MTDDRLGPPPIEPLSDVSWARVERGLWARMDGSITTQTAHPERRRWWIALPIAAAAAAIVLVVATREAPRTEVVDRGSDVARDVRVAAPPNAPTTATFDDAHIELAPASVVVMRRDRPATVLERGAAWFAVAPRVDRPPFVVFAGDATVRVLGTRFRVLRTADDGVEVEVDHGAVEVTFRGSREIVRDGQQWTSTRPETIAARRPAPAPIEAPKTGTSSPRPSPAPAIAPTRPEPPATPAAGPDLDHAKFDRLVGLEQTNPRAAMTGYLELSQAGGKWAANALFAAGRLAADRGDARARTLLEVYLRRFPAGANVDDARALLARLPPRAQ